MDALLVLLLPSAVAKHIYIPCAGVLLSTQCTKMIDGAGGDKLPMQLLPWNVVLSCVVVVCGAFAQVSILVSICAVYCRQKQRSLCQIQFKRTTLIRISSRTPSHP